MENGTRTATRIRHQCSGVHAIPGGPLQIPGPLIRVTEGTEVRVYVRNRLEKEPLILHGMSAKTTAASNASDQVTIAAGEERELRFVAGVPGTYYYWAAASDIPVTERVGRDSQLSGAFIVEPRGGASPERARLRDRPLDGQ